LNSSNNKLPTFSDITIAQIPEQLDKLLNENRAKINQLLAQSDFTWNNLIQPLDTLDDRLHQFWSPISHMNAVVNDDEIRKVYNECLPKLSQYHTEISHNQKLFEAIQSIADAKTFGALDIAQKKAIKDELRDFKLAGVTLPPDKKKKFAELVMALSQKIYWMRQKAIKN
jgi:oligopeptidase A